MANIDSVLKLGYAQYVHSLGESNRSLRKQRILGWKTWDSGWGQMRTSSNWAQTGCWIHAIKMQQQYNAPRQSSLHFAKRMLFLSRSCWTPRSASKTRTRTRQTKDLLRWSMSNNNQTARHIQALLCLTWWAGIFKSISAYFATSPGPETSMRSHTASLLLVASCS